MKLINRLSAIIFAISLLSAYSAVARLKVLDVEPSRVELLSITEMRFVYISFVMIDGKKYLIKQKKSDCIRKLVGVVRDAVMADLAEGLMVAHQVDIIPAGVAFPGKVRTDWPATIHTVAPGKMIKEQKKLFRGMNIKQANIGFRLDMLPWMAKDDRLIFIVAFDTFFCNHDRHRGNLFYNPKDDSFCAIDMDSSFKYNLCGLACNNFSAMLSERKLKLSKKEVRILRLYSKHLQFLIDNYDPIDTLAMYDYFAAKAGFVEGAPLYLPRFIVGMLHNKRLIVESYADAQRLVKIVEKLILKQKKRRLGL